MKLEIAPASDADFSIVGNLVQFYIYDMAPYTGMTFPADGLFAADGRLGNYFGRSDGTQPWSANWRGFPFLIKVDEHPAGFALVKRVSDAPPNFDMGEFFIGAQHRRRGVGRRVATHLFDTFAGQWEVRELPANQPAQIFWRRIVADYTGGAFVDAREIFAAYDNREFVVQRFHSRISAQ